MAIARTVEEYLLNHGVRFDVVPHRHSHTSMETAQFARIPGDRIVKSVILEDDEGFVMAILPSTRHVMLGVVSKAMKRKLHLATEDELPALFGDCDPGAIPPIGPAYGVGVVIDDSVRLQAEIYFEAGDHENLIRMTRRDFMGLMQDASVAQFAYRT
jgi:Ala-tRNA(Pro) deacylase